MREVLAFMGFCIALLVVVFGMIIGVAAWGESKSCAAQWRDSGFGHRWNFFGGCQIKFHGHWLPEEKMRQVDIFQATETRGSNNTGGN